MKWIPLEDGQPVPKPDEIVLCWSKSFGSCCSTLDECKFAHGDITHWAPITKPT